MFLLFVILKAPNICRYSTNQDLISFTCAAVYRLVVNGLLLVLVLCKLLVFHKVLNQRSVGPLFSGF